MGMKYLVVLSAAVCSTLAAPVAEAEADPQLLLAKPYINSGSASGPLTPLVGDLVATNRGYASLSLEGFSEDVNEDGFVDPIAHAAPVVAVAAPVAHHVVAAPAVAEVKTVEVKAAPAVVPAATYAYAAPIAHHVVAAAPAEVKTVEVKAAPAVTAAVVPAAYHAVAAPAVHVATAPVVHHVGYQVHHQVHHVPQVTVQKHTSTHTTHHVINHAPVVGAFTGVLPVAVAAEAAPAEEAAVVEEA